jgi:hypothetical protein
MGERLSRQQLVIVEGRDEVHMVEAFLQAAGRADIEVRSFDGVDNLRGYLKALTQVAGFEGLVSLGIMRDAEDDATGALASIQGALGAAELGVPGANLTPAGVGPRVVVLINPIESMTGSLEDVFLAAAAGDPALECADEYVGCLNRRGAPPVRPSKSRVHALIAAKDRPESSLGVAAKRGYFPLDHVAFDPIRRLLALL